MGLIKNQGNSAAMVLSMRESINIPIDHKFPASLNYILSNKYIFQQRWSEKCLNHCESAEMERVFNK